MVEIVPRIYLGSVRDANCAMFLQSRAISHLLTVDSCSLASDNLPPSIVYKWVCADDECSQNLLDHFMDCICFIGDALHSSHHSTCLVHCQWGQSRSVTVLAAYLMHAHRMTVDDSLASIKEKKADICPNTGFLSQLKLFGKMGNRVDSTCQEYLQFKLQHQVAISSNGVVVVDDSLILKNPECIDSNLDQSERSNFVLKCSRCRRLLCNEKQLLAHDPCSLQQFYSLPIRWMQSTVIGQISGKLHCPKCSQKVGNFNWFGTECGCGKWITPSFHLHAAKVDKCMCLAIV